MKNKLNDTYNYTKKKRKITQTKFKEDTVSPKIEHKFTYSMAGVGWVHN